MSILTSDEQSVVNRLKDTGDHMVRGTGAYYWANNNHPGCLKEAATSEEVFAIQTLARERRGGVKLDVKIVYNL